MYHLPRISTRRSRRRHRQIIMFDLALQGHEEEQQEEEEYVHQENQKQFAPDSILIQFTPIQRFCNARKHWVSNPLTRTVRVVVVYYPAGCIVINKAAQQARSTDDDDDVAPHSKPRADSPPHSRPGDYRRCFHSARKRPCGVS